MSEPKKERNIKANEKWNIKSGFENDTVRPTLTYKDEKKEKPAATAAGIRRNPIWFKECSEREQAPFCLSGTFNKILFCVLDLQLNRVMYFICISSMRDATYFVL